MKTNKMIGLIQPKKDKKNSIPDLHIVGCLGKITSFKDTSDGRYLIDLNGLTRFKIINEIKNNKSYRECNVSFDDFIEDINLEQEQLKFSDLELIFKDLKLLFEKKGYIINWKSLEKQSLNETINALAMASPFSLEEKQVLLESQNLKIRKNKIAEILSTYTYDNFNNTTVQ
jgi:Lon protease-like protein